MKRMIVFLFIFALLLGLCACQKTTTPAATESTQMTTTPTQEPTTPEMVTVSGSFTATVRDVIPDYVFDDTTPCVAIITEYQCQPFTLAVGPVIASQLQAGETYVFTIKPHTYVAFTKEYLQGLSLASLAYELYDFEITDIRSAEENETGIKSLKLTIE